MAIQVEEFFARLGLQVDEKAWKKGTERITAAKVAVLAFATVAAKRAAGAFKELAAEAIDYGSTLEDIRIKTGVNSQFLETLGFAAGGGVEGLQKASGALTKFGIVLKGAIEKPTSEASEALAKLGISMDDPAVQMGDLQEIMERASAKFAEMGNGAEKNAILVSLMGKSGADVSQILTELTEKTEDFNAAGGALADEEREALDGTGDVLGKASEAWDNLKRKAIAGIAPEIKKMADSVMKFFEENRAEIQAGLRAVVTFLADGARWVIGAFDKVTKWIRENKKIIGDTFVMIGKTIKAVVVGIGWLVDALKWVGRVLGESAAQLTLWFMAMMDWFGRVGDWFGEVKGYFAEFFGYVEEVGTGIESFFVGIGRGIRAIWEEVIGWVEEKVGWVKTQAKWVADKFSFGSKSDYAANLIGNSMADVRALASGQPAQQPWGFATNAVVPPSRVAPSITAGGVSITMNAGALTDPAAAADMIGKRVKEVLDTQWRNAAATLIP